MATEVTVRGAGIFGLSCAWAMARAGARVAVVDPSGPGAGASGGVLGALAPHVPEGWNAKKQVQLDSLLAAPAFWAGVEEAGGVSSGYARTGRLQPVADVAALELARRRAGTALELWGNAATWEVVEAPEGFAPVSPTGLVIRDTLSARLHPRQAVAALVAALRSVGVEVVAEAPDRGAVVHASGAAGLAELSEALARPVGRAVKGQAALLGFALPEAPQLFAEGIHVVPHADGTTAVGSVDDREAVDLAPDGKLEELIARVRALVPALAEAPVVERWAGWRPRARTRAPMLGGWPGRPGHFVANGGFKIGFGMAPGVAAMMAGLVLEGRDRIPEGFRVEDSM